jgi:hypothetical protein
MIIDEFSIISVEVHVNLDPDAITIYKEISRTMDAHKIYDALVDHFTNNRSLEFKEYNSSDTNSVSLPYNQYSCITIPSQRLTEGLLSNNIDKDHILNIDDNIRNLIK